MDQVAGPALTTREIARGGGGGAWRLRRDPRRRPLGSHDRCRASARLGALACARRPARSPHGLAYRIVEPDGERRHHLLEETGHGYLNLELAGSLLAALVVVGFTGCVLAGTRVATLLRSGSSRSHHRSFALQEHAELSSTTTPSSGARSSRLSSWLASASRFRSPWRSSLRGLFAERGAGDDSACRRLQARARCKPRACRFRLATRGADSARCARPARACGPRAEGGAATDPRPRATGKERDHPSPQTRSAQSLHRDADRSVCGRGGAFAERVRALGAHRHGTG